MTRKRQNSWKFRKPMGLSGFGRFAIFVWVHFLLFLATLEFAPLNQFCPHWKQKRWMAQAWLPLVDIRSRLPSRGVHLIETGALLSRRRKLWATRSSDDVPPIPCQDGLSYLPFQQEVILDSIIPSSRPSDGRRGILLADEMGLGKTVSIIGSINVLLRDFYNRDLQPTSRRFKALIVAPKSVLSHWEHELNRWVVLPENAISPDRNDYDSHTMKDSKDDYDATKPRIGTITAKDGIPSEDHDIYLINYEIVGKYLEELFDLFGKDDNSKTLDVLVCDECHYLKSVDSQRTHATLGHHKHSASQPGVAAMAERLWLVTGSPILNNPLELFPLLNVLAKTDSTKDSDEDEDPSNVTLEAFPEVASLDKFRDRYCGRQETLWGVTYKGGKNLSELRKRLIEPLQSANGNVATTPLMVRRTKKQVLPELPDKRHQLFPLDDGGIAASEEFELLEAILKDGDSKDENEMDKAGMETYLQGLKVADLKKLAKDRGIPVGGRKVELIERLLDADVRVVRRSDDAEDVVDLSGAAESGNEESILFGPIEERANDAAIDLQSSALSVLQSAPNENRKKIMRDLLHVPKIMAGERTSGSLMGGLMKARHQTALRKVPYVIELLEIALLSHKVVVFSHHRDVQEIIYQHFSDKAVALNGDTPPEDRMKNVQAFQNDPNIKLFVGSIRASGLGISLTASSHVVFVEMDWSPSIIQQAEDRCHRVGQEASVLVQYIYFKRTIDEHLSQLLVEKQRTLSAAIEEPPEECSWVFDFGKHSGKVISDVAAEDPGYLKWLVDEKIYIDRRTKREATSEGDDDTDGLREALIELGFLNPLEEDPSIQTHEEIESMDETETQVSPPSPSALALEEAENHVITFGKHKGRPLKEIPRSYLVWVSLAGASKGKPGLTEALQVYLSDSSSSISTNPS